MTLLNYLLTDDAVYVLTDTVISDPDDLAPVGFTTKVYPLPHLQALICGTGHVQPIVEWVAHINLHLLVRDIVQLDQMAPSRLRALFGRYALRQAGEREITTTLYHFGFDNAARRFAGFAYRSVDHFCSEPIEPGFGFKPAPEWPIDGKKFFVYPNTSSRSQGSRRHRTKRSTPSGVCRSADNSFFMSCTACQALATGPPCKRPSRSATPSRISRRCMLLPPVKYPDIAAMGNDGGYACFAEEADMHGA